MTIERVFRVVLLAAVLPAFGCSGGESGNDESLDDMKVTREEMPHEIAVLIDAGNAAFSSADYETARRHYLGAASRDSTVAAAWYGVAMAERALGNDAAADSALQRLGQLGATAAPHHGVADSASQPVSPHGSPHGAPPPARDSTTL